MEENIWYNFLSRKVVKQGDMGLIGSWGSKKEESNIGLTSKCLEPDLPLRNKNTSTEVWHAGKCYTTQTCQTTLRKFAKSWKIFGPHLNEPVLVEFCGTLLISNTWNIFDSIAFLMQLHALNLEARSNDCLLPSFSKGSTAAVFWSF